MVRLEETTLIHAPVERCFDLARSVEVHLAGNVHFGESAVVTAGVSSGLIGLNERVTWRAKHLGVWQKLTSEITILERPAYFRDVMIQGAFASMTHDHFFNGEGEVTEMRDVFAFAAPLGILGRIAEVLVLRSYMKELLRERNAVVRDIAESGEWRKYLEART